MDNKKVADLLEELIYELKRNDELFFIDLDNDRIAYIEGVIKELREEEMDRIVDERIKKFGLQDIV